VPSQPVALAAKPAFGVSVKLVVAPLSTICAIAGLIVPLLPALGVTFQVCRVAEHVAVCPPFAPLQVHVYGWPSPVTTLGVPALQRFVGGASNVAPLSAPQTPSTGFGAKLTLTAQSAVIGPVV
jgi:hypothetical protein